jgi:hypothetical protein
MAGRTREEMHQHGFVGLRLRRFDARSCQRKRGHENDEAGAYDAKEGVIHGITIVRSAFSLQLPGSESVSGIFVGDEASKMELAPARGNAGAIWGVSLGD